MLPQNAYDSGLRGIRLFDSSGPDGRHLHTQDIQYLAPDGIHLRDGRASGTARPLAPPQYAHPVRTNSQPLIKQEDYNSSGIYATQAANAEHMLRRKTPNGTLAAGYDGAPAHLSTNPPPLKHVVLPFAQRFAQGQSRGGMRESAQRSYSDNILWQASLTPWEVKNEFEEDRTQLPMLDLDEQVMNSSVHMPGHNFDQPAHEVPTVLQPPYQPALGPTASNDAETYGPYYANGRTRAYKPAAVRDTAAHPFNPCPGPNFTASPNDENYFNVSRNQVPNGLRSMQPDGDGECGMPKRAMEMAGQVLTGTSLPFKQMNQSSSDRKSTRLNSSHWE